MLPVALVAQPTGYYLSTSGLTGQPLKIALRNIIRPHTQLSYTPGLWNAYYTTDKKLDGKLWDVYSDVPGGTPAYEYTLGTNQCSGTSPSGENGCYNREHTWPQSKFTSDTPMQTDLFIVYPTDYFVNSRRGDYPYGKVGTASQTFTNGSKIGNNVYPGTTTGNCFEPIDSFKGDLARNYFYVSTCYRNDSAKFVNWESATQVNFTPWTVQLLLEWHHLDPVSKKEIDRNNAVYALQGNRNPFIDHPEFADCIWGTMDCTYLKVQDLAMDQTGFVVYPNPAKNEVTFEWQSKYDKSDLSIKVFSINGNEIYNTTLSQNIFNKFTLPVNGFPKGFYIVKVVANNLVETKKLIIE